MENKTQVTPNRNVINGVNAPLLEKSINQKRKQQQSKHSLIWGTVNVGLLAIILYDLIYTCPLYTSYVQYIEYVGVIILLLNILYHFGKYLRLNLSWNLTSAPVVNSCLSASTPGTPSNKTQLSPELNTPTLSMSSTPMNTSALSWMSNSTPNDSYNFPVKSDSWLYSHGSPQSQNVTPVKVPRPDTSGIDFISDECSLQSYLKDFEANEKKVTTNSYTMTTGNALSTFWSHPLTKNPKDASSFLKRTQYQLSSPTARIPVVCNQILPPSCTTPSIPNYYYGLSPPPTNDLEKVVSLVQSLTDDLISQAASASNSPKTDDRGSPRGSPNRGMETWIRLTISVTTLTQWNANLRIYLSQTILHRLITEFDNIDDAFNKHGFNDIQIGKVGLDRLRKTAQTAQALQFIPNLPTLIPFLELTPNQEYLVKRIKELAKTGCMSDFKWNSGSSFNEKDWDASLPTDSAIIMHLFAAYLDTQLLPLPSKPDVKPFSGYHYLKQNEKLPTLTDQTLLIQQCSDSPPHYRVIVGQETHELVKGYNNLFHSILLFLYFVDKKQHGMIGRVNLGKAGLNMLWIIQSS